MLSGEHLNTFITHQQVYGSFSDRVSIGIHGRESSLQRIYTSEHASDFFFFLFFLN